MLVHSSHTVLLNEFPLFPRLHDSLFTSQYRLNGTLSQTELNNWSLENHRELSSVRRISRTSSHQHSRSLTAIIWMICCHLLVFSCHYKFIQLHCYLWGRYTDLQWWKITTIIYSDVVLKCRFEVYVHELNISTLYYFKLLLHYISKGIIVLFICIVVVCMGFMLSPPSLTCERDLN